MLMLTTRGMSLKAKGILYESCVRSVMVCGRRSETWQAKEEDIRRIERADLSMIRSLTVCVMNSLGIEEGLN